jgi:NADPH:quinone reductase-like Zn-dependent oxidoreductase
MRAAVVRTFDHPPRYEEFADPVAHDPDEVVVDAAAIAAAMNPGMSSWLGLRRRAELRARESVLVLGATGDAGRMAIQIAKHLGAGKVVAAGRNPEVLATLPGLGADRVVELAGAESIDALGEAAAEVDVVIDYLWGKPAEAAIPAIVRGRTDRSRALRWVQIGSVAGPDIALPSVALRAADLKVMGSGQGSGQHPRDRRRAARPRLVVVP